MEVKNEKLQTGKSLLIIYNNCNKVEAIHCKWVIKLFPQESPHRRLLLKQINFPKSLCHH